MFQLAFQRALKVHLLVELRPYPVGLVENLEPPSAALDAALGRGRQAGLVQLRSRNQDGGAMGVGSKGICA